MAIADNERTPLLAGDSLSIHPTPSKDDPDIVDFLPSPDPDNPLDWTKPYKWALVALLAFNAFAVTFTCIGVVPVASRIIQDLSPDHKPNKAAAVLLVTVWELGEAAGPLLIGPLSEILGRVPVVNAANIFFIASTTVAALSRSTHLMIVMRVLTGMAVSANVLNPAIVGDVFIAEERGAALSTIMVAPLLGGAFGPALAGAIAEGFGWRWMLWACVMLMGLCEALFLLFFREPYKVVILRRKVARLKEQTGNHALRTPYDEPHGKRRSTLRKLAASILMPFSVFFSSPALILAALYGSTTFTFFYIMSTTLPDILEQIYHLTPTQTGLAFVTFSAGSLVAVTMCNLYLDRIYIYLRDRRSRPNSPLSPSGSQSHTNPLHPTPTAPPTTTPAPIPDPTPTATPAPPPLPPTHPRPQGQPNLGIPEHRLPLALLGAFLLPPTILLYGLLPSTPPSPLPYLLLTVTCMGLSLLLAFLPVLSYVVDAAGPQYAASAMTAVIVVRCLFGTFLPLGMGPLVEAWGREWAFGGAAAGVGAMAGVLGGLFWWGEALRGGWGWGKGKWRGQRDTVDGEGA